MRRIAPLLLVVAALAAAGAAPAVAGGGDAHHGCPQRDASVPASARPGASKAIVPRGANRVLLCRYYGIEPRSKADTLKRSRRILDRSLVHRLAKGLNALPVAHGAYSCPTDDGTRIIAYFRYPSGHEDPVSVSHTGCAGASNGRRWGLAVREPSASIIATVEGLVP